MRSRASIAQRHDRARRWALRGSIGAALVVVSCGLTDRSTPVTATGGTAGSNGGGGGTTAAQTGGSGARADGGKVTGGSNATGGASGGSRASGTGGQATGGTGGQATGGGAGQSAGGGGGAAQGAGGGAGSDAWAICGGVVDEAMAQHCQGIENLIVSDPEVQREGVSAPLLPGERFDVVVSLESAAGHEYPCVGLVADNELVSIVGENPEWSLFAVRAPERVRAGTGTVDSAMQPGTIVRFTVRGSIKNADCAGPALQFEATVGTP